MRVPFHVRIAIPIFIALLLLNGANAVAAALKGKVKKGVYSSPERVFSLPLPDIPMMQIGDSYEKDGSGVVDFFNPFGAREGIHYMKLTPELKAAVDKPETRNAALSKWFDETAMPKWFLPASPNSKVLSRGAVRFEDVDGFGGLLEVPGGSALVNMATSKQLDSHRAFVVIPKRNYVLVLWREATDLYDSGSDTGNPEDWPKSLELLKPLYRSVTLAE